MEQLGLIWTLQHRNNLYCGAHFYVQSPHTQSGCMQEHNVKLAAFSYLYIFCIFVKFWQNVLFTPSLSYSPVHLQSSPPNLTLITATSVSCFTCKSWRFQTRQQDYWEGGGIRFLGVDTINRIVQSNLGLLHVPVAYGFTDMTLGLIETKKGNRQETFFFIFK